MATFIDHYQVLRVGLSASEIEIKQAYLKLSRSFHPDKYKGPDATATFQRIGNAYAVLKDKSKRKVFDVERQQFMGDKEWAFPEDVKRDEKERNDSTKNPLQDAPKNSRGPIEGVSGGLTFASAMRPDLVGRPRRRWKPRPELQIGLYTIYEEDEDPEEQEPQVYQDNVDSKEPRIPAERLVKWHSGGKLFNPTLFMPTRSSWMPRTHTPAQLFCSWKASELQARNRRVKKWHRLADELRGQIELRRQNALRQQTKVARSEEDLKIEVELFVVRKERIGHVFQSQNDLDQALLGERWFKTLQTDIFEAEKKMEGIKSSIRMFMDQLQDHQDDFEHAEHKALLAVANRVLNVLEKAEYVSDKDPRDVAKSKIEWKKLTHIGVTEYQSYRQPGDIQKACQVAWKHEMVVEEDFNDVRICRRCKRDVFFNCFQCKHCASFMCSTCKDRVHQLKKYHEWLEEQDRSDYLFGV
ncbi:DnaJ-domain-containing protein [Cadophora sp. DSE1049]|nr:DnaJ-domain-containing protein [Cadophora sp. DSE1049]